MCGVYALLHFLNCICNHFFLQWGSWRRKYRLRGFPKTATQTEARKATANLKIAFIRAGTHRDVPLKNYVCAWWEIERESVWIYVCICVFRCVYVWVCLGLCVCAIGQHRYPHETTTMSLCAALSGWNKPHGLCWSCRVQHKVGAEGGSDITLVTINISGWFQEHMFWDIQI